MRPVYKRVLLKISGEALAGSDKFGINEEMTRRLRGKSSRSTTWVWKWQS